MKANYKYQLDTSSRKYPCPSCGKRTFVRYIDTDNWELLGEEYGRCDREVNCSYHKHPGKQDFRQRVTIEKPVPSFIPAEVLKHTLQGYDTNSFVQNLVCNVPFPLPEQDVERVVSMYYLGTITGETRKGAVTFPYIDIEGKIRAVQAKQFNQQNHTTATDWLHSIIERTSPAVPDWLKAYKKNEKIVTCLFGEHLLKNYYRNPVALVEAPKTAIYGTLYFGFPDEPDNYIWLAVYNLTSLTYDKCKVLKGRKVYLFPDLSQDGKAFQLWSRKADELSQRMPGTLFRVSDLLEQQADEMDRIKGLDLADFLINQDWKEFRPEPVEVKIHVKNVKNVNAGNNFFSGKGANWTPEITALEQFFKSSPLPDSIRLNQAMNIINPALFVQSHLDIVKGQNGNQRFLPYLERLQQLRTLLSN